MACGERGYSIIPYLIAKIDDSTQTNLTVTNFGGVYTVGDLAYLALQEIIADIPTFELLGIDCNSENDCGYGKYWSHLRENNENKHSFRLAVQDWYYKIDHFFVWKDSNLSSVGDCFKKPNVKGHYEVYQFFQENPPFHQLK